MMTFTIDDAPATLPHRPAVRAGVARTFNGYMTDTRFGAVTIEAWPHRGMTSARQIARRIHLDPAGYLWAVLAFNVPGVIAPAAAAAEPRRLRIAAA